MELVLRGTGFRQNAVVGWNGEERITSFTNSEQLVVTLSDLDFQTAGEMELRVLNPGASEPNVVSNAIVFPVRHGFGSPELEVVVPEEFVVSDLAVEIQLLGREFDPTSVVLWGGNERETRFLSSTELLCSLEAGDLSEARVLDVEVLTPGDDGGRSGPHAVRISPPMPVPVIVEVHPATLITGAPSATLTVLGTGFGEQSVVWWGETELPTELVSSTELAAAIGESQLALVRDVNVLVRSDSRVSNEVSVSVTAPVSPVVQSVAPGFVNLLGGDVLLAVSGTGFRDQSVVLLDGVPVPTVFVSTGRLQAEVSHEAFGGVGYSEVAVRTLDLESSSTVSIMRYMDPSLDASDLAFDATRSLVYVAVPGASTDGNRIVALDPVSGSRIFDLFVGSDPKILELSGDDAYLYVALAGAPRVVRVDLESRTVDLEFDLGRNTDAPYYARDLAVSPVDPDVVVAVLAHPNRTPSYNGTALYDGGELVYRWYDRFEEIYFARFMDDGSAVLGSSIGDEGVYEIQVGESSLDFVASTEVFEGVSQYGFELADGRIYGSHGEVLSADGFASIGQCDAIGYVLPQRTDGRIVYLSSFDDAAWLLVHDSETFEPRREVRLPWPDLGYDFRYEFGSLVPAGAGQVAFRAWDRAVICPLPMEARSPVGGSLR